MNTFQHYLMTQTRKAFRLLLAALLFLSLPVQVFAAAKTSDKKPKKEKQGTVNPASSTYPKLVIGPGDILDIEVYGETSGMTGQSSGLAMPSSTLPTQYQVDTDGQILFPFLGPVHMSGLTPIEASEKIARLLRKPRKVTVLIKESNTYWVSVLGNVSRPGRYQILGKPTLLSTLALAGGPLAGTDMGGAILIHDNLKIRLDLNKYLTDTGKMDADPYVYPGDTLMVQKSPWPSIGEIAIVASILASAAVITVELTNLRR